MGGVLEELDAIFNVPFKLWFCDKCPRDKQSVEWHDDNAKCLNCGRTRVQWLIDQLRSRTPGPATAKMLEGEPLYPTHTNRWTNETTIDVPKALWDAFVAEVAAQQNAPADRGGE